jgi:hypothetical protein
MISWAKSGPATSAWRLIVSVVGHGDCLGFAQAWGDGVCDGDPDGDDVGLVDGLVDVLDGLGDGEVDPGTTKSVTAVPGSKTEFGPGLVCHTVPGVAPGGPGSFWMIGVRCAALIEAAASPARS